MIVVTGGAGFIGSNFIYTWQNHSDEPVVVLDKLTYAGNLQNLSGLTKKNFHFIQGDIGDSLLVEQMLTEYQPRALLNFAAESHVDRSIHGPGEFIQTNVVGVYHLLESTRDYWRKLPMDQAAQFRFLQVSTDEVYGSLSIGDPPFTETHPYQPNSPYAASKASADHLVRAWHHTYGLPVLTTNCSNNYGPYHFPEKLIPLVIHNALTDKPLPIYGDGQQIRDWLYVEDHCRAIVRVLEEGRVGETYNIGGWNEQANIDVVHSICTILDEWRPKKDQRSYTDLIMFVKDRLGHDRRYAIDARKIEAQLGWRPQETFTSGLRKTVRWYLDNQKWVEGVVSGEYRCWVTLHYGG